MGVGNYLWVARESCEEGRKGHGGVDGFKESCIFLEISLFYVRARVLNPFPIMRYLEFMGSI